MPSSTEDQPLIQSVALKYDSSDGETQETEVESQTFLSESPLKKQPSRVHGWMDFIQSPATRDAFPFAFRMATLLTVASLFVLVRTADWKGKQYK